MPNFFIDRPIFAWVVPIFICLIGIISMMSMGIDSYPTIAPPEVTVTATYPGDVDLSASAMATAATGLTVNKDTSSITVSESPTSVVYGAEATSVFTVNVNPAYGENLPGVENVTVNVGSTSCVAARWPTRSERDRRF